MSRLPFSFHQTFIPERIRLSAMLSFAASEKDGTVQEISAQTGIPMGKSSGKTPAILDYCCGMGLVTLSPKAGAVKSPRLTTFGRVVLLEDKFLKQPLTQWLAHLHLCRPDAGAEAWFLTFVKARKILGDSFTPEQLESFLRDESGGKLQTSLIGPLIRTYTEAAGFLDTRLLDVSSSGGVSRRPAPLSKDYVRGYAAWLITLLETHFPDQREVAANELKERTFWDDIGGWSAAQSDQFLTLIQERHLIDINRQLRPWVITRLCAAADVWSTIYQDLV
jgi:hypothetical protein